MIRALLAAVTVLAVTAGCQTVPVPPEVKGALSVGGKAAACKRYKEGRMKTSVGEAWGQVNCK